MIYRCADNSQSCVVHDVDLRYPHGLCFDSTGQVLYVADAGERQLHVFQCALDWDRPLDKSAFKRPAVEWDAFQKTKQSIDEEVLKVLEGGVKGIDVDPAGRVVAATCRNQILRFFEIQAPQTGDS